MSSPASLRILITTRTLRVRGGAELYVRDIAEAFLARGHLPIVYSTLHGAVANDLLAMTVPVVASLKEIGAPPDIIHGQDHPQTMEALLRFPGVPAVFFCHGWVAWDAAPPRFPRLLRYVAVNDTVRDRLLFQHAIPEDRVRVLLNFADLERFRPRGPLPSRPRRALVLSNYVDESNVLAAIREACAAAGIELDAVGAAVGNVCERPEEILGNYDLVFACGRAAIESLVVGAAVVICNAGGVGPMVTAGELDRLRYLNFGQRLLTEPATVAALRRQIARYDATDAAEVSRRMREVASRDAAVEEILALYREVIEENRQRALDLAAEQRAAAEYLGWLVPTLRDSYVAQWRAYQAEAKFQQMQNSLGWRLLSRYGPIKYRYVLPTYRRLRRLLGKRAKAAMAE